MSLNVLNRVIFPRQNVFFFVFPLDLESDLHSAVLSKVVAGSSFLSASGFMKNSGTRFP